MKRRAIISWRANEKVSIVVLWATSNDDQKRAFAGVGRPINEVVWRSSKLNFASRRAEKAAKINATNGSIGCTFKQNVPHDAVAKQEVVSAVSSVKIIVAGATPNVITSANESNSFPIGDDTWSKRATIPSKKSNIAPMIINKKAYLKRAPNAKYTAIHPEMRLLHVSMLGMVFFNLLIIFY